VYLLQEYESTICSAPRGSCRLDSTSQRNPEQLDKPRQQLPIIRLTHGLRRAQGAALEHCTSHSHGITPPHWSPCGDIQQLPPKPQKSAPEWPPIGVNHRQLVQNSPNF
jgi:hypothetical protein